MNKCYGCKHYKEYNDNKFTPLPLCTRERSDLEGAAEDFKHRYSKCDYYNNNGLNEISKNKLTKEQLELLQEVLKEEE